MNTSSSTLVRRKIGRPLSFDREAALQAAMLMFWKHGYESTSLKDLTEAMGVTPPSVYAAFGDKKKLFMEAVDRYVGNPVTAEMMIDQAASAKDAAWALISGAAVGYTGKKTPAGCLLASSAIACSEDSEDVRNALAGIRGRIQARLKDKILSAIENGELPEATNAGALAGVVMAVIQGMSTLARDGTGRKKLMEIAETSMAVWPS